MTAATAKKPEVLYKEPASVFRLRALLWLVEQNPDGLNYEDTMNKFNRTWPKMTISKESVVRSLKVLLQRGQVQCVEDSEDGRRCVWYPNES